MKFIELKEFPSSLNKLWKRGGQYQTAANKVDGLLSRAERTGGNFAEVMRGLKVTHHGETRIERCVKYDLTGRCRLITIQSDDLCLLAYCGTHDDCDKWLDRNRGFKPVIGRDGKVHVTQVSIDSRPVGGPSGHSVGQLFERLPDELFDRLVKGLSRSQQRAIEKLDGASSPEDIVHATQGLEDLDQLKAVFDTMTLLQQEKARLAVSRVQLYLGEVVSVAECPIVELPEIVDSDVIRQIRPDSPQYREALDRFMRTARYRDWMLFMHPEQQAVVDEDFAGPAKLVGVSGSGKTCVVVQRAVRLAIKYPGERILVLTINPALARLMDVLIDACAPTVVRPQIEVKAFFELCQQLLRELEPGNERLYSDVTWKHEEHVDEIWQEYYRCGANNYDARCLQPLHDTLLARGWNPERYIREEMDWVRSALARRDWAKYLEIERTGRTVGLTRQFREALLEGLSGWESKMAEVGVVDGLGIAEAVSRHRDMLTESYRSILLDEAQDFGNLELETVRRLVALGENDLFICGDAAQAVTTKYQLFKTAGIDLAGARSRRLTQNYRNSQDVLKAAFHVLLHNMTEQMMDREDFEILDPEYSSFSAATPLLLESSDLEHELAHALNYVRSEDSKSPVGKACIAVCGYSLYELSKFGRRLGLTVLDGAIDIEADEVFLSDLEQTKGFEFETMCVLNCSAKVLPNSTAPEDERFRDLARFYVAMTRAKRNLILSFSGEMSSFLAELPSLNTTFLQASWSEYSDDSAVRSRGIPERLQPYRSSGRTHKLVESMSAEEFLYTDAALGLPSDFVAQLRRLVDGVGLVSNRVRTRWRTLGDAASDLRSSTAARAAWGPDGAARVLALVGAPEAEKPGAARLGGVHGLASA